MKKETDMAEVKSVAKMLLMTDVHETKFSPMVVQHPFTSSGIVVLPEKDNKDFRPVDITRDRDNLQAWRKAVSSAIDHTENPYEIYTMVNKPYIDITFRATGTSLEKTLMLRVALEESRPKRPTAVIGETQFDENSPKENYITVKNGEQLIISAEDGVTIYYTTDDTCPCQNSASRKIYTGPIPITENTKFRIAAYKDGMDYSERLNITVTVDNTHQHSYGSEWKSDENGHWHECDCGAVSDRAGHDWMVENAKEATATEPGYTGDKTCKVCGYEVKGEGIPAKGTTEPSDPTNPGGNNTTNPVNPDNDKPTNPNGDENKNTNSPQTGDNSNLWMWFAVLFISGGMLVGTTVYSKKKKYSK